MKIKQQNSNDPLEFRIQYLAQGGEVKMTSAKNLLGVDGESGDDLLARVLETTTDFVRARWVRVEVSTRMAWEYGRFVGGYHRLLATRNLQKASDELTLTK